MRNLIKDAKRIIIKIGTSSITHKTGNINLKRMEQLARVISDLENSGKEVALVSSGAIGAGMERMGMNQRPKSLKDKQAAAAVGQAILMQLYQKFFGEYNQNIAQVLLTKDVFISDIKRKNVINTLNTLLSMNIIPIINENDSVSTEEIEEDRFGDNDTLSAMVAGLTNADLLLILSDVDGLYNCNPFENPNAKLITYIDKITDDIYNIAGCSNNNLGTGGMITKLHAAMMASEYNVKTIIANSKDVNIVYEIIDGKEVGTYFDLNKK